MKKENKTYLAIVKIKGHEPEDFIMTDKNSAAVKKVLISFFIGNILGFIIAILLYEFNKIFSYINDKYYTIAKKYKIQYQESKFWL